jgi:pyrroline-5-carboxylate reductase
MAPPDSHEAVEPPSQESGEEYGATLMADMKQPLLDMGMDDDTAKEALAGIFNGMAKCLRGGSKAAMPMMMGDEGEEPAA